MARIELSSKVSPANNTVIKLTNVSVVAILVTVVIPVHTLCKVESVILPLWREDGLFWPCVFSTK